MPLVVGLKNLLDVVVTEALAVDFLNCPKARVLGTAQMIYHMEITARNSVLPYLPQGQDTVGTYVELHHTAATPIGMRVVFRSELIEFEGTRLRFFVAAADDVDQISHGIHERRIIDVERFAARVAAKGEDDPAIE